jgi:hypothetical protein
MNKKIFIVIMAIILLSLVSTFWLKYYATNIFINSSWEEEYQKDVDLARMEHLEYWTWLVEEYYDIKGFYPFQDKIKNDDIVLVRISTNHQSTFFTPWNDNYNPKFDNNSTDFFKEYTTKDFINELESWLWREIYEKYDIQKYPVWSPVWYNYFTTERWYLLWVTCITCWVTPVTTLLYDWYTPTLNIASEWMIEEVYKSYTRDNMINNEIYNGFKSRWYKKEWFIRFIEEKNFDDSKKY